MFPFLYNPPKKEKDDFVQEQLYIERPPEFPQPEEPKTKEEPKRGVEIIQL